MGWADMDKPEFRRLRADQENVIFSTSEPYSALFPRVHAVLFHGGAGTLAEVVRAGVPSLIKPALKDIDQIQNAKFVARNHLGFHVKDEMREEQIAGQIAGALNPSAQMRQALEDAKFQSECTDGLGDAIKFILAHPFGSHRSSLRVSAPSAALATTSSRGHGVQKQRQLSESARSAAGSNDYLSPSPAVVRALAERTPSLGAHAGGRAEFRPPPPRKVEWRYCDAYCSHRNACAWTKFWSCPWQSPGLSGKAKSFGSTDPGFYCCCEARSSSSVKQECGQDDNGTARAFVDYSDSSSSDVLGLNDDIRSIFERFAIFFHFKWTAGYDKEHLLPLAHIVPASHSVWYRDGKFYFGAVGVTNVREVMPFEGNLLGKHFLSGKAGPREREVFFTTHHDDLQDLESSSNMIALTHGIDEDDIWLDEAGTKNADACRFPSLVYTSELRSKRNNPVSMEKLKRELDSVKETVMYIATYRAVGELHDAGILFQEHEKVKKGLDALSEKYNLILMHHPNDSHDYAKILPKAIVPTGLHRHDILTEVKIDIVIGEPSGATYDSLALFLDKPFLLACDQERFAQVRDRVMNEKAAFVVHETQEDWVAAIQSAQRDFSQRRKELREARLKKQGSFSSATVLKEFADYHVVIETFAGLDIKDPGFEESIKELQEKFREQMDHLDSAESI